MMNKHNLFGQLQCDLRNATQDLLNSFSKLCETKKINVLYLDDDIRNLRSFKGVSREMFNLFPASTINEARDIILKNKIALIMCDYMMPGTNGLSACEELHDLINDIPVIMVTGYRGMVEKNPLYKKRNVEIITKPFNIIDILNSSYYKNALGSRLDIS